jgi:aryl-alcohol dehydrogenase-like predicted oxidoreductase
MTRAKIHLGDDLAVGRIGYGAMQLTGPRYWGEFPDHDAGVSLLRHVVDAGVTLIDTADVYGPHSNEILIHDALYPYPEDLIIATKGGFVRGGPDFSSIDAIGNANYLRQCVQMSARRLGVERIDLYYLHSGRALDASFEEQVGTLADMRRLGFIRHIGLSNVTPEQLRVARSIVDIAAVTAHFNVAARGQRDLLEAVGEAGAVFVPWQPVSLSPPGSPKDAAGPQAVRSTLEPIASLHGISPSQVALAWLLQQGPNVMPVPGTSSAAHLLENLAAQDVRLTGEELEAIDAIDLQVG